ncbi:hypothetical protein V2H45_24730 [Tumidithrix elongata RA019]|uniref:Uncharacterized protein n=1 Tax=Tumidithrix elongata BACA0141 TaxID=2716417 RepID=A0AAW9Q481_9CYAN|nr:hypothetical protein [Tumidithrix elongata RA019]
MSSATPLITKPQASEISEEISPTISTPENVEGKGIRFSIKKLRGLLLLGLGYLLSPLCWWNDLFFNLPIAYGFGYLCSLASPKFLFPGAIAGYWLSNLVGIVLIQMGALDVLQKQSQARNFKKELQNGLITSTAYTLVVLALIQFKFINLSAIDLSSLLPAAAL